MGRSMAIASISIASPTSSRSPDSPISSAPMQRCCSTPTRRGCMYLLPVPLSASRPSENKKGKRVSAGGWSQARYQRRLENLHQKHIKEVSSAVEQVVREEQVRRILVAGDAVALPLLREQLSPQTRELLIEVGGLDMSAADADVYRTTLDAFREADAQTDAEWVSQVLNAYHARGLATTGAAGVKAALERGQSILTCSYRPCRHRAPPISNRPASTHLARRNSAASSMRRRSKTS